MIANFNTKTTLSEMTAIIFGAGAGGKRLAEKIIEIPFKEIFFTDNDTTKHGKTIAIAVHFGENRKLKIINPQSLETIEKDKAILFIVSDYYKEILEQLVSIGFESEKHLINGLELSKFSSLNITCFLEDYFQFKEQLNLNKDIAISLLCPILNDRFLEAGTAKGAYFWQDLYVANRIFKAKPDRHLDIGSRVDGFVAHIAAFRHIDVMDIRKIENTIPNVNFVQSDAMNLDNNLINSYDSISSLHAIEHFGLGRYGDNIDADGHKKAIFNIAKYLRPGGVFYFAVPMGKQRIEFNAHRIFSLAYLLKLIEDNFSVERFSYVNDKGDFFENVLLEQDKIENNYGIHGNGTNGVAVLELVKK